MSVNRKAQSLGEMAILVSLVTAAVFGMQAYVKRGLQARYKTVVDAVGDVYGLHQYEPYYASSDMSAEDFRLDRRRQNNGDIATVYNDISRRQGRQKTGTNIAQGKDWNW